MKLVILAGGYGTRLAELTKIIPKPLIRIGDKPIIWHVMKIYSHYGVNDFIICLGYKGAILKRELEKFIKKENWKIIFANTGLRSMTGERIKRIKKYVIKDKYFCMSYGDGLSDVNIKLLIDYHIKKKKIATLTAVKYRNPKGVLKISKNSSIEQINEKPTEYINGGFFVLSNKIFKYLKKKNNIFEKNCLPELSKNNELIAYKHNGFWACMDTMREKININKMWNNKKKVPWKVW
jgi:glucose-1-phosphate cytidylyltransferase